MTVIVSPAFADVGLMEVMVGAEGDVHVPVLVCVIPIGQEAVTVCAILWTGVVPLGPVQVIEKT